jgi:hypothetical protein
MPVDLDSGFVMNIRTLRAGGLTAAVGLAALLVAGCAAVVNPWSNTSSCEHALRDALAEKTELPLKVTHTGAGIDGSRVVIEGLVEGTLGAPAHPAGASAATATAASAPHAASAPAATAAAPSAPAFNAPAAGYSSSGLTANSASQMNAAAAAESGANTGLLSFLKKKKTVTTAIAGECEFDGKTLSSFHWLAPAAYAAAPAAPASDADQ